LGVADPIYNLADSRRIRNATSLEAREARHTKKPLPLARLAGSADEIRTAAKLSRMPEVQLLEGSNASGSGLRAALLKRPQVLHFAVHVVSPTGRPEQAALALSLTANDMPELLTREAIAGYRVPGSLVILSGCSSQQGETLPSAGLIGLSRAWLLAGASAVIVSAWPTADDSGHFFSSFYSHLQPSTPISGSLAKRAAAALQQAQLEMRRSNGYGSSPSSWAAYSVISKE
jgi:CHAT domain-containing protein